MKANYKQYIELAETYGAPNYKPLPVVLEKGKGVFVWDAAGRRYFDFLSAYSALNQGHNHPKIVAAAKKQLGKLTLTSRAFHNTLMGEFLKRLCELTGQEMAILMNSGAEGVETAIKAMRMWGYQRKRIGGGKAQIIVCRNNFHGRTTTIVGFSSDPDSFAGFGPATPGFTMIPYGDAAALEAAITPDTCGFLVEPIQGEAGVKVPPPGYLAKVREICSRKNVLLCVDEIQTGLGRTGKLFCSEHEKVKPDLVVLGKALSGGLYPISAVAARKDILNLLGPGKHGSTFGGNPLACAIGLASLDVVVKEKLAQKADKLGAALRRGLAGISNPHLREIRGQGLLVGLQFDVPARPYCLKLMEAGILAKDSHETTIRLAPPLVITPAQLKQAVGIIRKALSE
jgi:ornithine--oxo-acid transaminase